jgi:hypothetical protein
MTPIGPFKGSGPFEDTHLNCIHVLECAVYIYSFVINEIYAFI